MLSLYHLDNRAWRRWQKLAQSCQQRLKEQTITPDNPGTILKDVNTMLEFVGSDGLATRSRNATFPAERLPELNAKMGHPIELTLNRALLRDYPNLAGIFILLRVMDLLLMKGNRLVVCPPALDFWRGLNPTEQYFALLEAFLFQAHSSVLGEKRRREEEAQAFATVAVFLGQLSERWRTFEDYECYDFRPQGALPPWNLFVQQQLGLIEIRRLVPETSRIPWGGRAWLVGAARLTNWGTAVTWALLDLWQKVEEQDSEDDSQGASEEGSQPELAIDEGIQSPQSDQTAGGHNGETGMDESADEESELDEMPDESELEPDFGSLHETFQPYFPEWQTIYAPPKHEPRSGTHVFKVSLAGWQGTGSIWRRIAVPPGTSLDGLAWAILRAFKFDDDHLYDFSYRDQRGKKRIYNRPECEEGPFTSDITVAETDLALKDEMLFTFDYGDNWEFRVRLEKVEIGDSRLKQPKVIGSAGKAPEQYPESGW